MSVFCRSLPTPKRVVCKSGRGAAIGPQVAHLQGGGVGQGTRKVADAAAWNLP